MKTKLLLILMVVILISCQNLYGRRFARWHTNMGEFTAEIRFDLMPITGNNFISLAENHFYDNLIFHRVISGFVIQDGCPYGTGYGGPGYTIQDEYCDELLHDRAGMLAMAKTSQPNSAGSQYYITLAPTPHLNGNYAVFGRVIEGLDIVLEIGQVPTNSNNLPLNSVVIDSLRMLSLEINSIEPNPDNVIVCEYNSLEFIVDALDIFTFQLPDYEWYVNDELIYGQTSAVYQASFNETGSYNITCKVLAQDITYPVSWTVNYSPVNIIDQVLRIEPIVILDSYPNPFKGTSYINYKLNSAQNVTLNVYDIKGRLVESKESVHNNKGDFVWEWMAKDKPSGIYLFELRTATEIKVIKKLLLK